MPALTIGTFLGARLSSLDNNIGWGVGQPSQLTVRLVNDPKLGAVFTAPPPGSPVFFSYFGFTFNGIFQKYEQRDGIDGSPIFEVTVTDPREVLEGAQVILSAYNGSVGAVRNLYNVFGYWENALGFGGADLNDGGIPWYKIKTALLATVNSPTLTDYGAPLRFMGHSYALDLSELPTPPTYYRIGGVSVGLLELIAQICEDGGCDFFVELVGQTIRIRTVNRFAQPPLGTISALVNQNRGINLTRSSHGLEVRNELTSAFLVGGDVTQLYQTDALTQFWGYDVNGNPITGTPATLTFFDNPPAVKVVNGLQVQGDPPQQLAVIATEVMNLNAAPVADIVGSVVYKCTTLEMRLAQANYESWSGYVQAHRPDIAAITGLTSPFRKNADGGKAALRAKLVNDARRNAFLEGANAVLGDLHAREMRLYEFVKGYADEYMGRKYLVGLPFLLVATNSETLHVSTSYEVADGGYQPEGSQPLSLSSLNEDIFRTQDGRFKAFVLFENIAGADLSKVSPQGSVTQPSTRFPGKLIFVPDANAKPDPLTGKRPNKRILVPNHDLYLECQVDSKLVATPAPAAVVTLPSPLLDEAVDNVGDMTIINAVFQMKPAEGQRILQTKAVPMKVAPAVRKPSAAAVPLKSNVLTYGPWFASGAPGKVRMEYDPSLTPWTYGGFDAMNLAGAARVTSAVTNMQVSEAGSMELAGPPAHSLGDTLQAGGPNLTNIEIRCGKDGVTTNYRFATFTPQRYGFSKGYIERLKRLSLTGAELRRSVRTALKEQNNNREAVTAANRTARAFMDKQAKAHKRETPHDVLHVFTDWDDDANSVLRTEASSATLEEGIVLCNAQDDGLYRQTAVMGYAGLIRPFCTTVVPSGVNSASGVAPSSVMPSYVGSAIGGAVPNLTNLDPWKWNNDIEAYSWGETYSGVRAFGGAADRTNSRVIGLRAPLVLVGWGYDTDCQAVPGSGTTWASGCAVRQDLWKAGPVDALWDQRRGVWTVHGSLKGTTSQTIPAGSGGSVKALALDGTNWTVQAWNWGASVLASGAKVLLSYVPTDNRWYTSQASAASGAVPGPFGSGDTVVFQNSSLLIVESGATSIFEPGATCLFETDATCLFASGSSLVIQSGATQVFQNGAQQVWQSGSSSIYENGSSLIVQSGATTIYQSGATAFFQGGASWLMGPNSAGQFAAGSALTMESGSNLFFSAGATEVFQSGSQQVWQAGASSVYEHDTSLIMQSGATTIYQSGATSFFQSGSTLLMDSGAAGQFAGGASLTMASGSNFVLASGATVNYNPGSIWNMGGVNWNMSQDTSTIINPGAIWYIQSGILQFDNSLTLNFAGPAINVTANTALMISANKALLFQGGTVDFRGTAVLGLAPQGATGTLDVMTGLTCISGVPTATFSTIHYSGGSITEVD